MADIRETAGELPTVCEYMAERGGVDDILAQGFSSNVTLLRSGNVVKVSDFAGSAREAERRAHVLRLEHERTALYLEKYLPESTYINVMRDDIAPDRYRVAITQPFIGGMAIRESWVNPTVDNEPMLGLLAAAFEMYEKHEVMPDICAIEHLFRVRMTPNIIVNPRDGHPTLVDTTQGKIQRNRLSAPLWNRLILWGAHRAENELLTGAYVHRYRHYPAA